MHPGGLGTQRLSSCSSLVATSSPSNLPHNCGTAQAAKRAASVAGGDRYLKGGLLTTIQGRRISCPGGKGCSATGREQQMLKKKEQQQVVISPGGISLSLSHRCAEADLVRVLSRAETVPSPPGPRQAGNPAAGHQGTPCAWAWLLPQSRGK